MRIVRTQTERGGLWLACLAAFLFLEFGCGQKNDAGQEASRLPGKSEPEDRVILMVGETKYYGSDFQNYVHNAFGEGAENLEASTLSRLFDEFSRPSFFFKLPSIRRYPYLRRRGTPTSTRSGRERRRPKDRRNSGSLNREIFWKSS